MDVQMIEDRINFEFEVRCPTCGRITHVITRVIKSDKALYLCDRCYEKFRRRKGYEESNTKN